jgi:monoamine oxidase
LPWSILKDVEGVRSLDLTRPQMEAIENATYAEHSKATFSFKDPLWKKRKAGGYAFQGIFRGQLAGQGYWDSSRGQEGTHGLLTSQRGGKRAQEIASENAAADALTDLRHFFKDLGPEENHQLTHWQRKPFAKGSRLTLKPGAYLKHLEMLSTQNENSMFYLAGEHMSFKDAGTMNGAVRTAIAAAEVAVRVNQVKPTTTF